MFKLSLLARGTLARNLTLKLLPPLVLLVGLDLLATWIITHKIEMADWQLEDIFWLMVLGQVGLIALCVWVVVRGVVFDYEHSHGGSLHLRRYWWVLQGSNL